MRNTSLQCEGYISQLRHLFVIPNGENVWKSVPNLVLKFHNNPTVNESKIIIFWDMFGYIWEKERVLGGGEGKTKLRRRGGIESIISLKTDLRCLR